MKKIIINSLLLTIAFFASTTSSFAQNRILQAHKNGSIAYEIKAYEVDSIPLKNKSLQVYSNRKIVQTLDVTQIDSITFANPNDRIYVGVVAFNTNVSVFPISNDLIAAKNFISNENNDIDRTALCYGISKGITLFDEPSLPEFDKIFLVSFTDGIDNGSDDLYMEDGRMVPTALAYDAAHDDLVAKNTKDGLDAYAIGFGKQPLAADMQKLVIGKGEYKESNSSTLNSTFQEIAQSVIASAKNVVLQTQTGLYTEEYPKYVKLTVTSSVGDDVIMAKIVGQTLSIVTPGAYATFDSPVEGTISTTANKKIDIPLNNFKFVKDEAEYPFTIAVQVSKDNIIYYADTEDASAENAIGKKIAIVLVLDCSTSLGDDFAPMQTAANNFINTLSDQVGIRLQGSNQTHTVNGVSFDMVRVEGGTFMMGSIDDDGGGNELPVHQVTLSSFSIGKFEVTQGLWKAVMGSDNNPSYWADDYRPVGNVSWYEATEFISKLNEMTGKSFRLPTEAEWEYAARGGNKSQGYTYSGSNEIDNVAWYNENSGQFFRSGTKDPNEMGIYDMAGNAWEWCSDWYDFNYYYYQHVDGIQTNPTGPTYGDYRILRGGCYDSSWYECRVSYRNYNAPYTYDASVGFRLVHP